MGPGADGEALVAGLAASAARVERILLTHGHGDHVGALAAACAHTGAPAHIHPADRALRAAAFPRRPPVRDLPGQALPLRLPGRRLRRKGL